MDSPAAGRDTGRQVLNNESARRRLAMQLKQKAWRYDGSSWGEIDFALPAELVDWDEGIRQQGFRVPVSIEVRRGSYCASVYESARDYGQFLVLMTTRGNMFPVIAVGLPALLSVLNQMIPVVRAGGDTEQKYEREDLE
jgi:hypothetical protein